MRDEEVLKWESGCGNRFERYSIGRIYRISKCCLKKKTHIYIHTQKQEQPKKKNLLQKDVLSQYIFVSSLLHSHLILSSHSEESIICPQSSHNSWKMKPNFHCPNPFKWAQEWRLSTAIYWDGRALKWSSLALQPPCCTQWRNEAQKNRWISIITQMVLKKICTVSSVSTIWTFQNAWHSPPV